ncbi:MAG TPA: hypothetical protein VNC23_07215, partial [Lapillicoccus sp.]|nr:hypothetical protein [Lapillicoccus sp.]
MRLMTRKIVEEDWLDDWMGARDGTWFPDLRLLNRVQNTSSGLLIVASGSPAVEADRLGHQQH